MSLSKAQRLKLFVDALDNADPVSSYQDGRQLLERKLNEIEDLHSGAAFEPTNWQSDGRMYPPQDDYELESKNSRIHRFKTIRHEVEFGDNGSIRITSPFDETVLIDKPGSDGLTIDNINSS